uniref:Uncharacterized protein n=1 Tax=Arundo donax TaxID=35708 RepID=A0A0A9E9F1_ARUDO
MESFWTSAISNRISCSWSSKVSVQYKESR